jgi:hypothetical protein
MTRLFTDGAEMRDILFWDGIDVPNACTVASATPAISPYYYDLYDITGNSAVWKTFTANSECYSRARIRAGTDGIVSTGTQIMGLRLSGTKVSWVSFTGAGLATANVTTVGIVGTAVVPCLADTWYLFEVYFKEANAPNGRFVVFIDGNNVIDYTGDTQPAAATTFDNLWFQGLGAAAGVGRHLLIDDIAINDTAGAVDNSYCGDGIVVKIEPDGNGTHNNWHGSDADDVDNYQMCHEFPKDDDTTYVYHDNTSGVQQQFAMSHLSFTGYTILRIYAEARARKTAAAAMTLKLGQLAAGGADVVSAGRALYTNYARVIGDDSFVNPVDTNPWEEADIDAIEFVAQVT